MKTKSDGAKERWSVRLELEEIRAEHVARHTGFIWDCSKCRAAWQAIEDVNPYQQRSNDIAQEKRES